MPLHGQKTGSGVFLSCFTLINEEVFLLPDSGSWKKSENQAYCLKDQG